MKPWDTADMKAHYKPTGTLFLLLFVLLTACAPVQPQSPVDGSPEPIEDPVAIENPLRGTQWQLSGYGDPADLQSPSVEHPATLFFGEKDLSGTTGCNNYGADYAVDEDSIALEMLFQTEMACLEPGLGDQEAAYMDLLHAAETFALQGQSLTLSGAQGVLLFEPVVSPAELGLVRRLWRLAAIRQTTGQNAVEQPVAARFLLTAWFEEGRIGGRTGCNSYGAPYQLTGEPLRLDVGEFEMTAAGCPDEESTSLEQTFIEALRSAESFSLEEDQLVIAFPGGELVFVDQPDTAADENAVYTAVLREWDGGAGSYVFRDQTHFNRPGVTLEDTLEFVQQQLPPGSEADPFGLAPQVLEDFAQRNESASSLAAILHTPFPAAFLSEEELSTLFSPGENGGWAVFGERFPASNGIYTFSRVGFNPQGDQALVYMGLQTEDFEGGYYSLLVKRDGLWSSASSFLIWGPD